MFLCEAALRYAGEFGWPVFPLAAGTKQPLFANPHPKDSVERAGCHGECGRDGHGLHDATTDPATILRWWGRTPAANIGIATGAPGPDVLDVDVKHGAPGLAALEALQRTPLLDGAPIIVRTPSGGLHYYGRGQGGQGNGRLPKHGLDFRGAGGYVAAPPSLVGGVPYRFERWEWPLPNEGVCWQKIRDRFMPPMPASPRVGRRDGESAEAKFDKLLKWAAGAQEGNRNSAIHWTACRLAEGGAPEVYFRDLHVVGVCLGLKSPEVLATIASARHSIP